MVAEFFELQEGKLEISTPLNGASTFELAGIDFAEISLLIALDVAKRIAPSGLISPRHGKRGGSTNRCPA